MNKAEFDEMAALVVRLRKDLELHTDALRQSNAQCSKLLVQNEQLTAELDRMKGDPLPIKLVGKLKDVETSNKTLHSELVEVRAALATVSEERDSLKRTLQEWEDAETEPHVRVAADDIADHVVPPVLPMCMTCHHCGNALDASVFGPYNVCTTIGCPRTVTNNDDGSHKNPYDGPCHAGILVRHE